MFGPIWGVLGPLAREGDNGPQAPVAVLSGRRVHGPAQLARVKTVCEVALPGTQGLRAIWVWILAYFLPRRYRARAS